MAACLIKEGLIHRTGIAVLVKATSIRVLKDDNPENKEPDNLLIVRPLHILAN
jgi:hypothetical protein